MKLSQERTKKSKRLKTKGSRLVLHSMDRVANSPACTKSLLADQIDSDTETLQPNQRQAKKLRKKIKRAGAQMKAKGKIVKVCTYLCNIFWWRKCPIKNFILFALCLVMQYPYFSFMFYFYFRTINIFM